MLISKNSAHIHAEPRKIFAKFNHFRSAVFLKNSEVPRTQTACRKYCAQKSVKFGGNVAFLCDLAHSFLTNAKQDKIQVAKVATKQKF